MPSDKRVTGVSVKRKPRGKKPALYTVELECGHKLTKSCPGHSDEAEAREYFMKQTYTCWDCDRSDVT
jgi:hypothetical protein